MSPPSDQPVVHFFRADVVHFWRAAGYHLTLSRMSYPLLGWTAAGSAGRAVLGSWLMTEKLKGRQVKLIIGVVLLVLAAKMVWDLL